MVVDKRGNYVTNRMHDPVLTTVKGDWSGIKTENQFFFNNERFTSQSQIPGWSSWRQLQQDKFNQRVSSIGKIGFGVVAIGASIPSGGASLSLLAITGTSFGIASGSYSVAKGLTDFTISFSNNINSSDKVPSGLLNATVGVTIISTIKDEDVTEYFEMGLDIIEGSSSLKFTKATDLQKLNSIFSGKDVTIESINIFKKIKEDVDKNK